jgi:hypothetical protein
VHACMHVYFYVCMYVSTCACMHTCMCVWSSTAQPLPHVLTHVPVICVLAVQSNKRYGNILLINDVPRLMNHCIPHGSRYCMPASYRNRCVPDKDTSMSETHCRQNVVSFSFNRLGILAWFRGDERLANSSWIPYCFCFYLVQDIIAGNDSVRSRSTMRQDGAEEHFVQTENELLFLKRRADRVQSEYRVSQDKAYMICHQESRFPFITSFLFLQKNHFIELYSLHELRRILSKELRILVCLKEWSRVESESLVDRRPGVTNFLQGGAEAVTVQVYTGMRREGWSGEDCKKKKKTMLLGELPISSRAEHGNVLWKEHSVKTVLLSL